MRGIVIAGKPFSPGSGNLMGDAVAINLMGDTVAIPRSAAG
jgi:hypothetical protein